MWAALNSQGHSEFISESDKQHVGILKQVKDDMGKDYFDSFIGVWGKASLTTLPVQTSQSFRQQY